MDALPEWQILGPNFYRFVEQIKLGEDHPRWRWIMNKLVGIEGAQPVGAAEKHPPIGRFGVTMPGELIALEAVEHIVVAEDPRSGVESGQSFDRAHPHVALVVSQDPQNGIVRQ